MFSITSFCTYYLSVWEKRLFLFSFSFLVCLFAFETTDIAIDGVKVHIVRSLKYGNEAVTLTSVFYLPLAQYKFSHHKLSYCAEQHTEVRPDQLVNQGVTYSKSVSTLGLHLLHHGWQ